MGKGSIRQFVFDKINAYPEWDYAEWAVTCWGFGKFNKTMSIKLTMKFNDFEFMIYFLSLQQDCKSDDDNDIELQIDNGFCYGSDFGKYNMNIFQWLWYN